MEAILTFLTQNLGTILTLLGFAGFGGLLNVILKKWVSTKFIEKLGAKFEGMGYWTGALITVGLAKWRWTKGMWNKVIEPFVLLILKTAGMRYLTGFVRGMESDNPSVKDD